VQVHDDEGGAAPYLTLEAGVQMLLPAELHHLRVHLQPSACTLTCRALTRDKR